MKADPLLNLYDNEPHTLDLCLYQLKNPNVFKLKSKYEDGLLELLECKLFDPTATDFERITVQPGKDQTLIVDRAEGSNYLGVVAQALIPAADRSKATVRVNYVNSDTTHMRWGISFFMMSPHVSSSMRRFQEPSCPPDFGGRLSLDDIRAPHRATCVPTGAVGPKRARASSRGASRPTWAGHRPGRGSEPFVPCLWIGQR